MRVTAPLALIFGFMWQLILDGQTFNHAMLGVLCGVIAFAFGTRWALKNRPQRARSVEGYTMAALGIALTLFCVIHLPSDYRFQSKFNERSRNSQTRPARISVMDNR
jgi:hypothetical protein